jgi:hypothetical protein
MTLYARKIVLRNCGRFTVVQSDFGADYRTHTHASSEALYASLTRGITWKPRIISLQDDTYDFNRDYDLDTLPIWFSPGIFTNSDDHFRLPHNDFDSNYFNVVHEYYPSTSKGYSFEKKSGELKEEERKHYIPTYGTWQGILPNRSLTTYALSDQTTNLEKFIIGQTFMLGKKRTMVQIVKLDEISVGKRKNGEYMTPFLQIPLNQVPQFRSFEILSATMRYLLLRGKSYGEYLSFDIEPELCLPIFILPKYILDRI